MSRAFRMIVSTLAVSMCPFEAALIHAQTTESTLSESQKSELIRERDQLGEEAGLHRQNQQLPEAIACVQRMVKIEEQVSGRKNVEVASVLDYLAELLTESRDWQTAIQVKKPCGLHLDRFLWR